MGGGGGGGADSNYDQCQESGECNNLNPLNKEIVWKAIKHRAGGGTVGLDSLVEGRQGEKKRIVCILFLFFTCSCRRWDYSFRATVQPEPKNCTSNRPAYKGNILIPFWALRVSTPQPPYFIMQPEPLGRNRQRQKQA